MASGFEGRLGEQLLSELLCDIDLRKLTGVLRVSCDKLTKGIVFESGEPLNAFSTHPSEHLDARLIKEGRTSEGLVGAAKRIQPDPCLLGATLVEKGIASTEVVQRTERELATEIVLSLFEWTEAEYKFEPTENAAYPRVLDTSLLELVLQGARHAAGKSSFENMLARPGLRLTRSNATSDEIAASLNLNSTEGYVYSLITSSSGLAEITALSGLDDQQIKPAVGTLVALGLLSVASERDDEKSGLESDDEVIRGIARKLHAFETATYYEILGVEPISTTQGINRAYQQLEEMFGSYRADYLERADVQQQLNDLFGKIRTAHQTLRDTTKRRDYDRQLAQSTHSRRTPGQRQSADGKANRNQNQSLPPRKPIQVSIPPAAPLKADNPEPLIERGNASDVPRRTKLPARKPIPIPELQMPVAPKNQSRAQKERTQNDLSKLAPAPRRPSGPLTRPPAVLSPEEVSRLKRAPNKDQQALHFYRQGRARLERRELEAAAHLFREAVKLDDSQGHYHFYLGMVLTVQAHARHEHRHHEGCHVTCKLGGSLVRNPRVRYEAERHFLRAAELEPSNAQIPLKLGQLYKEAGLLKKAELYLKQALMLDADNQIAKHELNALLQNSEEAEFEEDIEVEVK